MPTNEPEKITCPEAESLVAFARGEGTHTERAAIETHLASCDVCRAEVKSVQHVVAMMTSAPEEPTRDLAGAVLARLPAEQPVWRTLTFRFVAAAAAALLIIAGYLVVDHLQRPVDVIESPKSAATPVEVTRALDWLARAQEPDGSWDPAKWGGQEQYRVGITGLALLAFTGADDAARDTHIEAINRAADYLAHQVARDGRFGPFFSNAPYNHGIATVALLEASACGVTADLRAPIEQALIFIGRHQNPEGGWGYLSVERQTNTSVTAWQLHAVLLADALGWKQAHASAEKGLAWVASRVDPEGRAGYERPGDFPEGPKTLTAMAAFCLSVGAKDADAKTGAAVVRSLARLTRDASDFEKVNYYRSYFLSHALQVASERGITESAELAEVARDLNRSLARRQVAAGPEAGSWEPTDQWSRAGGRVYATAMAALSLQADTRAQSFAARTP